MLSAISISFENICRSPDFFGFFMIITAFFIIAKRGPSYAQKQLRKLADELGFSLIGGEPFLPKVRFLYFIKTPVSVVNPDPKNPLRYTTLPGVAVKIRLRTPPFSLVI